MKIGAPVLNMLKLVDWLNWNIRQGGCFLLLPLTASIFTRGI